MEESDIFFSCASFTADDNGFPVKENNNNEFVNVDKIIIILKKNKTYYK